MMDCDTTGVEPDIALIKYKKLVGGGVLKIVNRTVPEALSRLGYSESQVREMIAYVNDKETIEGTPALNPAHLPVFDCAFRPRNGSRSIHFMGHIRMMGAVQPFLSGAISKTVNLPGDATVEDIQHTYLEGWRLGLKAIAIYRDGSKRIQPLGTSKDEKAKARQAEAKPVRRKLPEERQSLTHKFRVGDHKGYITVGFYEDHRPGEIFVTMSKEGSTVRGLMDTVATLVSICLQYGVPLEDLVRKFEYVKFEPNGITDTDGIRFAHSIVDYIFRWLHRKFLPARDDEHAGEEAPPANGGNGGNSGGNGGNGGHGPGAEAGGTKAPARPAGEATLNRVFELDAPACPACGSIMVRSGACHRCLNCGLQNGCG
jgi:ribonucleoside-diphosphate reductase alpha chain